LVVHGDVAGTESTRRALASTVGLLRSGKLVQPDRKLTNPRPT
jgi:hypothetical protein